MPRKGHKSTAGVGDLYETPKTRLNISITETAKSALQARADELDISISELIERFSRGLVGLPEQEQSAKKRKRSRQLSPTG